MAAVGMKTKGEGFGKDNCLERLNAYYEAVESSTLGELLQGDDTYQWFRRTARPPRPEDGLGPYKYFPEAAHAEGFVLTKEDQQSLAAFLNIDLGEWEKVGSLNLPVFKWWKEMRYDGRLQEYKGMTLLEMFHQEFDMYDWHLRKIDGKPNYGWLRSMFHGISQQVTRKFIGYYGAYCCLREDKNTNLVSYPYYAKYQKEGDSTYFRHIDVNLKDLVEHDRGKYQIQGTVSLDDEFEDDCTEIVPGMHQKLAEWMPDLQKRGTFKFGGQVNSMHNTFIEEDEQKFKTKWVAVPCKAGDARITQPHLPHGAKGPAVRVRRTILPWYVALQSDHDHLEIAEGGTFNDLSKAHRDLVSGPATPSGLANRYGDIRFPFPAAVHVEGLGVLSDALVGRTRHDSPVVVLAKEQFFHGTNEERQQILEEWKVNAVNKAFEAWDLVRQLEKKAFGDKSYFRAIGSGSRVVPAPDDDPAPDDEQFDEGGHGHEDETSKQIAVKLSSDEDSHLPLLDDAEDEDVEMSDADGEDGSSSEDGSSFGGD
jgi:Phytanoyl-CoA dioxygenase (PhyH)